jgi:methoxymalonate biosynthesis protein
VVVPVKCLVWDLDNTLWDGTLLEDDQVELFDGVLDTIKTLDERGILQSVSSKNDFDLAMARLTELGIAEYFVLPKIGWGPKSESVREIADELRFAPEAVAFIDDRPQERAEVKFNLPEVRCYSDAQVLSLVTLPEFTPKTITTDSRRRRQMYQAGFQRDAEREELTVRTTQMNTTGVFYAEETLLAMVADPAHEVLTVTVSDRFGPYGAVGVVVLDRHPGVWHIKLLATSCRVVSLGVGGQILSWLVNEAERAGVHLLADFRPTERNRIMEVTYRFAGFGDDSCECVAAVPAHESGSNRLHLVPTPQTLSEVIALTAVDLSAPESLERAS